MPLWLFTLGRSIFKSGDLGVPYSRIAGFAVGLVIPLGLGLLAQRYLPRFAKLMVRILKTFSALLLLFIIVFAIVTNLYLFELFSWRVIMNSTIQFKYIYTYICVFFDFSYFFIFLYIDRSLLRACVFHGWDIWSVTLQLLY